MYKLLISTRAQKRIKELKEIYQLAVIAAFEEIVEDPFLGKPLTREFTGRFSYRVGVYRIIYSVNQKDKIIRILNAGHRGVIYK